MISIDVTNKIEIKDSYAANRVRSMFNPTKEQGSTFRVKADLPLDDRPWKIGLVVGPSGSGKTTIGRALGEHGFRFHTGSEWAADEALVAGFSDVTEGTSALAAVGLGTVPSWLRPFRVLSMGEQFRAEMARLLAEEDGDVVVDEFTSVVDRQIAKIGAGAFGKSWRRKPSGRAVCLSCHYDVADWLQPDWTFDTRTGRFDWRSVQRPPAIEADVWLANGRAWRAFAPHHYLDLPPMIAATYYVATVGSEPVAHLGVTTTTGLKSARACRLVVMPEWQGAGLGLRFLESVCKKWLRGENRYGRALTTLFHTSHPGLIAALRRRGGWLVSSRAVTEPSGQGRSIYRGHARAVAGFRYVGKR